MTIDLARAQTVGAAFLERAAEHPEKTALTIYRGSTATEHPSRTYAELARRAGRRAEELMSRLAPGERVLISLPTCCEFVEIYLACMLAGLVAVPMPPLVGSSTTTAAERVALVAGDCRPGLAFTTPGDKEALAERLRSHGLGNVPVEEPGDIGPDEVPTALLPGRNVSSDTLAVLQYSSGSTGSPKGVMLDHGHILANLAALRAFACLGTPDDSFGSWMPLHHDFGLFAQLTTALIHGVHTVLMSPTEFVKRPVEWFRMMDRFGTTVTSAPNFAFGLCLRLIRDQQLEGLDLSALSCIINGSEPIHAPMMAAFAKRFASIGLRPEAYMLGYGMAETTVYVSGTPRDKEPRVLVVDPRQAESAENPRLVETMGGAGKEIVSVGTPGAHETRIVDPQTLRTLPDGAIGEIWLRGSSIGRGYWDKPELSEQTFQAHLADDPDDAPGWLRTGDLGAVLGGDLFVTGRLKELVIVRGRNLYPHDLEQQARLANAALEGFVGAAFGVAAPDERVVLVHEVDPRVLAEDLPAVAADVMRELTAFFGVPVRNVMLVRRGTVRRTTSGKIQRRAMRERFLAGGIPALHSVLEPDIRRLTAVDAQ
ncbi:fatty acyl-AMP ligase [Streptomyces sp. NPDC013172]|uniref:fatty acyl-AMP ligase n=1 Tax=Streptomyces sp. NPDC013172 TaxID=3155009 RepID=UPI0033D69A05